VIKKTRCTKNALILWDQKWIICIWHRPRGHRCAHICDGPCDPAEAQPKARCHRVPSFALFGADAAVVITFGHAAFGCPAPFPLGQRGTGNRSRRSCDPVKFRRDDESLGTVPGHKPASLSFNQKAPIPPQPSKLTRGYKAVW